MQRPREAIEEAVHVPPASRVELPLPPPRASPGGKDAAAAQIAARMALEAARRTPVRSRSRLEWPLVAAGAALVVASTAIVVIRLYPGISALTLAGVLAPSFAVGAGAFVVTARWK